MDVKENLDRCARAWERERERRTFSSWMWLTFFFLAHRQKHQNSLPTADFLLLLLLFFCSSVWSPSVRWLPHVACVRACVVLWMHGPDALGKMENVWRRREGKREKERERELMSSVVGLLLCAFQRQCAASEADSVLWPSPQPTPSSFSYEEEEEEEEETTSSKKGKTWWMALLLADCPPACVPDPQNYCCHLLCMRLCCCCCWRCTIMA